MKRSQKKGKRRRNGGVCKHVLLTYYFRDGPAERYVEVVSMDQTCGGGRRVVRKRIGST